MAGADIVMLDNMKADVFKETAKALKVLHATVLILKIQYTQDRSSFVFPILISQHPLFCDGFLSYLGKESSRVD